MSVFGIDLGTCNSCIAKCDANGIVDVKKKIGSISSTTPSVVSYENDIPIIGTLAKRGLCSHPESVIAYAKREMDSEYCKKEIISSDTKRFVSPVEVSSCILWYLFNYANKNVVDTDRESEVTQAVITVPTTFNDVQRERTRIAAELAGIEVLALIQEPTAAAISYKIKNGESILVFDLGGGTLDVSIVRNEEGKYTVLGTPVGDQQLGGIDWDSAILDLAFTNCGISNGHEKFNDKDYEKLRQIAEEVKIDLSESSYAIFESQILPNSQITIHRSQFEAKCAKLRKRCCDIIDKAIQNANNPKIDRFVLVGGASCMPMIRQSIEQRYSSKYAQGRKPNEWIVISNPDEAIAIGAAMYAGNIANLIKEGVNVEDYTTHSYGFVYYEDGTNNILVGNKILCTEPMEIFNREFCLYTRTDNEKAVKIAIVENDRKEQEFEFDNSLVMIEQIFELPEYLPARTEIRISLSRNRNGIIDVLASCKGKQLRFRSKEVVSDRICNQIRSTIQLLNNSVES